MISMLTYVWLIFAMHIEVFLVLHMLNNTTLHPGHFQYFDMRLGVLFKSYGKC